ncbi:ABC transporter substrate-binding protein [Lichenihabitans sp. PAMC28606]|uniref:ABC transporter substrate-binding protein n=1 Tax=Lichenihabitans sp. PAMC28606 TaxID=2880932 RepID=UPI001D0AC64A|nr:ABC transporter substrate-binding protein [Lichenihabitans sp. PAMC28606]UDL95645.1 ABC transporter substrate-binding protein [Lichenihabitans sp. PAMC28606]
MNRAITAGRQPALLLAILSALLSGAPARAEDALAPTTIRIVYLSREGDVAYAEVPADDGVFRPALPEPSPGAELALRDLRATAHAANVVLKLERDVLAPDADAAAEAKRIAEGGAAALIADVPLSDLTALVKAVPVGALPLFDIRQHEDALRRDFCTASLFHVLPSTAMQTDALAQFLVTKNWKRVLTLTGPLPDDTALTDSFKASAQKFGARIVASKAFIIGNDPRRRDQTNVALMTASEDYDVLFLADTARDFGRFVPYEQGPPRPVVGTEGLQAVAWDALAERFGAPQVNHRFERNAHRSMTEGDWAAWVAVRAVAEAAIRGKATTGAAIASTLTQREWPIDVSKGVQVSFRLWDHQLRQSVMLRSGDAVVAYAPFDGFIHQRTPLDTLGADLGDAAEASCKPPP